MELRERALQALCTADPQQKVDQTLAIWSEFALNFESPIANQALVPTAAQQAALPGRPPLPRLIHPARVAKRSPASPQGLAALIHAIAHIEFNAINLALDAVWRFAGMPSAFYRDWLRVAQEEAQHFSLLRDHLRSLRQSPAPWDYGDFDAHDGLWTMCTKTADDIVARMALVPRTLEARGLDATPLIQTKLRQVGSPQALRAVEILDIILREEVGHVAIGNHWYRWLCVREGVDPVTHYGLLVQRYAAPRLHPPYNTAARLQAGFSAQELEWLEGAMAPTVAAP